MGRCSDIFKKLGCFISENHSGFCFFAAATFVCVGFSWYAQSKVAKEYIRNENRIIDCYNNILSIKDDRTFEKIKIDCLIDSLGLAPIDAFKVHRLCDEIISTSIQRSKESIELSAIERASESQILSDVKELLESQTLKIHHEYEALQIWCGILTVIFLVFSFYSLFKADDLVKQGRDGLRELNGLKEKGEGTINELLSKSDELIKGFEKNTDNKINEFNQRLTEITDKQQTIKQEVDAYLNTIKSDLDMKYFELNKDASKKVQDFTSTGTSLILKEHKIKLADLEKKKLTSKKKTK